ncbi:precorrin-3B C(17)-methyltransferase, partial [Leptospira interrogans serovar Pomona]|nr:precorrin-3B C(17)-methyltransferase [Leptospira interrogans serovar Pomona]
KYSLKDSSLKKGQKKGFSLRSTGDLQSKVNSDNGDRHLSLNITKIHGAFVKRSTTIMDSSAAKAVESLNLLSQIQKQNAKKDSKSVDFQKNTLSYIGRLGGGILFKSLEKFY